MYDYAGELLKPTVSEWAIDFNLAALNAKQDYWAPDEPNELSSSSSQHVPVVTITQLSTPAVTNQITGHHPMS